MPQAKRYPRLIISCLFLTLLMAACAGGGATPQPTVATTPARASKPTTVAQPTAAAVPSTVGHPTAASKQATSQAGTTIDWRKVGMPSAKKASSSRVTYTRSASRAAISK